MSAELRKSLLDAWANASGHTELRARLIDAYYSAFVSESLLVTLLEAWETYGFHSNDCALWPEGGPSSECTCGYEATCVLIDQLCETD